MRTPLYLLAVPTAFGGLAVAYPALLLGPSHDEHLVHGTLSLVMTLLVVATGALVLWRWQGREGWDLWGPVPVPHPQVDRIYDVGVVRPTRFLSVLVRANDRDVIDAYADGTGATLRGFGWVLRLAQNGNVQAYLLVVVVGAAVVAVAAGAMA
jgi:NADH:ubiquinone oxidoreductase subunit 5 (subunit L)/multisubunit Na+/H+ antiporter MnhA subunit